MSAHRLCHTLRRVYNKVQRCHPPVDTHQQRVEMSYVFSFLSSIMTSGFEIVFLPFYIYVYIEIYMYARDVLYRLSVQHREKKHIYRSGTSFFKSILRDLVAFHHHQWRI